jgi:hypothetical protein
VEAHEILGLRPGASRAEVAEAYRRHALRHHPDRGGDRTAFEAGAEAYRSLTGRATGRRPRPPVTPGTRADLVFHRRRRPITSLLRLARNRRSAPRSLS